MYKLFGYKWFSSATDSDITITLAKIPDQKHGHDTDVFKKFEI